MTATLKKQQRPEKNRENSDPQQFWAVKTGGVGILGISHWNDFPEFLLSLKIFGKIKHSSWKFCIKNKNQRLVGADADPPTAPHYISSSGNNQLTVSWRSGRTKNWPWMAMATKQTCRVSVGLFRAKIFKKYISCFLVDFWL